MSKKKQKSAHPQRIGRAPAHGNLKNGVVHVFVDDQEQEKHCHGGICVFEDARTMSATTRG